MFICRNSRGFNTSSVKTLAKEKVQASVIVAKLALYSHMDVILGVYLLGMQCMPIRERPRMVIGRRV